ncbi:MAG: aspartate/glutamate racemase family protein [Rhodospirillales bacterium]|nr:aspartate/glutamate racemase family protein [Rhodospirillales bacterium]
MTLPRLGMLTPSSNTALEPITAAMLAGVATLHVARFRVTEITLSQQGLAQFDDAPMLHAASLLADARVAAIGWNGTSGGWLGFDVDRRLCAGITASTGIPATTSMLALNDILAARGVRRLGLVTPYTRDVQARIQANYAALGVETVAECHLGISENFAFADVPAQQIAAMTREVAKARPDAIAIICTNLHAAPLAEMLEAETGILVLDTIATVVWRALQLAGADPRSVNGWGRLFREGT